jgi:LysR substrate binding domain
MREATPPSGDREQVRRVGLTNLRCIELLRRHVIATGRLRQRLATQVAKCRSRVHLAANLSGKPSIESSPCPPEGPSGRGGHRVSWSGCRRGQRFAKESFCIEIILREPFVVAMPDSHPAAKQDSVRIKTLDGEPFVVPPREPGCDYADAVFQIFRDN